MASSHLTFNLQFSYFDEDPGQKEPPFLAVGLLQDLDLLLVPVTVSHEPHEPQDPQLPLTRPTK